MTLETFQGTHTLGASRGRLCNGKAFLFIVPGNYRLSHRLPSWCQKTVSKSDERKKDKNCGSGCNYICSCTLYVKLDFSL